MGTGLAATVSRFALALGLFALAWRDLRPLLLPVRREALDRVALAHPVHLGLSIGLQMQLEYGVSAFVAPFMGLFGAVPWRHTRLP